jgi:FKBP-type peptidyl-prolyl cis-trans isomerase FkpA
MKRRRPEFKPAVGFAHEVLEARVVLSGGGQAAADVMSARAATHTSFSVTTGTLGTPVTLSATVRAASSAGSPSGTVNIFDEGHLLATLTLSPSAGSGRYAMSSSTVTLTPQPGGSAFFFGKHTLVAKYVPGTGFAQSGASTSFKVVEPNYTTLSDGVKYATIVSGSGAPLVSGDTATLLYTGYLAKNGTIFDDSVDSDNEPFSFTLGADQVIAGFEEGATGMQVGETRIVYIPASEGYGDTKNESIPPNSNLIFVLTLESISTTPTS